MPVLETLDDLGIRYFLTPMSLLSRLHLLNTFDDIGIALVCRPLRYMHRFAAFLLDSELYPIYTYSNMSIAKMPGLKADESLVSSMSRCSTNLRSGGGSGSSRRVGEKGRIRKRSLGSTRESKRSRRSNISGSRGSVEGVDGSRSGTRVDVLSSRSGASGSSKGKRRTNGHA